MWLEPGKQDKFAGVTFFRKLVVDPELKESLDAVLHSPLPEDPAVIEAKRRIRAMATPRNTYTLASMTRSYLEEKTHIGTEVRAFPLAGDFFLDALEIGALTLGQNLFKDHYSAMIGCYRDGNCPQRVIQGAFFAIDLVLWKTLDLHVTRNERKEHPEGVRLSFIPGQGAGGKSGFGGFLKLARQALKDAVQASLKMPPGSVSRCFLDFAVAHKERVESILDEWEAYHKDPVLLELSEEDYLDGAAHIGEEAAYYGLAAAIEEYRVRRREKMGLRGFGRKGLEQVVHPLYHAASMYLAQGNEDREVEAFDLAFRRYNKAISIFTEIHDRTCAAKAHVERARAHIQSGEDPSSVCEELHKAVCLVMAHIKDLPHGVTPNIPQETAILFLREKGYQLEADAYERALKKAWKSEFRRA